MTPVAGPENLNPELAFASMIYEGEPTKRTATQIKAQLARISSDLFVQTVPSFSVENR